ncbi:MAG: YkgJ family cysteine cluster protein [Candidatus Hydrogenedentes bacterium]|nr:YkgJ family cysteine cluster protein [Candidatus Hydrogenedentota bacterium]
MMTSKFHERAELRFECQECGQCCTTWYGDVSLRDEDIHKISKELGTDEEVFEKRYVARGSRGRTIIKLLPDRYCPFYRDGCTIHEFKPLTCASWPFWDYVTDSEDSWNRAGKQCPGVRKGRVYSTEEIERLRGFSPP